MRAYGIRWRELAMASAALVSIACSTTSQKSDPGPCGAGADGCVSASVGNTDTTPYDPADLGRDGKGTFYAALIDSCPTADDQQFGLVSEPAIIEADFTKYQLQPFIVRYRFDADVKEGDTAYLIGFLDDNSTVKSVATAVPDLGDTFTTCVAVEMLPKLQNFTDFIEPCLLFDLQKPYAFKVRPADGECDTSFLFDGGTLDSGGSDTGAGDAPASD